MAIIKCPECGHQISEKATVCPICGIGIAGKVIRCAYCGEVYLKADGLCPNCHRPAKAIVFDDEEDEEDIKEKATSKEKDVKPATEGKVVEKEKVVENENETPQEAHAAISEKNAATDAVADNDDTWEAAMHEDEATPPVSKESDPKDGQADPTTPTTYDQNDDEDTYIDDEENEAVGIVTEDAGEEKGQERRRGFLPVAVSLAITALIAAVCFYFYNENKMTTEHADLDAAINAGTKDAIWNFQRNHPDATEESRNKANEELKKLSDREQQEALISTMRDKSNILAFLSKYPDHPKKAQLLQIVDSIDWEEAKLINKKEAYEKYLAEHSEGIFAKEAKDKITTKVVTATEDDKAMAKSLFRDFFLAVNGKDTGRLTASMNNTITSFMGKENASKDDVTEWMKKQYEGGVQTVTWKLDHNYNIKILEQNEKKDYTMDFTGHRTSIHNDGRATTEHYKFNAKVNDGKISSMTMEKYTPSASSESSSSSSSSSTSKPSSGSTSKPASSSGTTSKPSGGTTASKPASSGTTSKPSGGTTASKPASSGTTSKSSGGSTSAPKK